MKKLSRSEMKHITGGYAPVGDPCKQYEGQTTWQCGRTRNGNHCTEDICYCDGRPPVCDYVGPCEVIWA